MSDGTQISNMTLNGALPTGSFMPFIVTDVGTGLSPKLNYRYDLGADLLTRVSYSALSASGGSALVGFLASGAGAVERTLQAKGRDSLSVKDYGAVGDGTNATTAFNAALAAAVAAGIKRVHIPGGSYSLTNMNLSADGMIWEGDGDSTILSPSAVHTNIMLISGDDVTLRNVKMLGNGTSTSSANGAGVQLTGVNALIEDVTFDGLAWGVVGFAGSAKRGGRFIRTKHRNTVKDSGNGGCELLLGGAWQGTVIEDMDAVSDGSADRPVLIFNSHDLAWISVQVRGGWYEGYALQGVTVTDENWDGSDRVFGLDISGGYYKDIPGSAIKAKLSKGIRIRGAVIDNCGGTPENPLSGLFGSILVNSIGEIDVSNNTLLNNGDAGIVFNGNDPWPKSRPGDGFGLASICCTGNIIQTCGLVDDAYGDGITLLGRTKSIQVSDNSIRDITRFGVYIEGSDLQGLNAIQYASVTNNIILDSPDNTFYAISIRNVFRVQQNGNICQNFGGIVANYARCNTVDIGPNDDLGNSAGVGTVCLFTDVENTTFSGGASCTVYDAWATNAVKSVGDRVSNGGEVYEVISAGAGGTSGTTTGTTAAMGSGPSGTNPTVLIPDNNIEWAWVGGSRKNNAGLTFSGATPNVTIGATANFGGLVGTAISGTPPDNIKFPAISSTTTLLVAGTATVMLPVTEFDDQYKILLSSDAAEIISWSNRTTTSFDINSDNVASTATVFSQIFR